ncbi:MAG: hypothetical protein ACR2G3_05395 [Solirubrobacterales bacterium]
MTKGNEEGARARLSTHIRANVVGYAAVFVALGGTAVAGTANSIVSGDIVNGEVKQQDVGPEAIASNEVETNSLEAADLASDSVGVFEIGNVFQENDIAREGPEFVRPYGIRSNAVEGSEVLNGTITRSDLSAQAEAPAGFSTTAASTGIICNAGCTEGTLAFPAGTYAIFGKIKVFQQDFNEDLMHVNCELSSGSTLDEAGTRVLGDTGGSPGATALTTLSMEAILTVPSSGSVSLNCADQDVGDVSGGDLAIIAIRLGSLN